MTLAAVLIWGHLDGQSPWCYAWALVPVLQMLWAVRAVMRHLARIDEYQALLLLKGLAVGFAVAMIASITMGFLGIAGLNARRGMDHLRSTPWRQVATTPACPSRSALPLCSHNPSKRSSTPPRPPWTVLGYLGSQTLPCSRSLTA